MSSAVAWQFTGKSFLNGSLKMYTLGDDFQSLAIVFA